MSLELIRLANGVRLALDPMAGIETTALGVWIRVGARHEGPAENGLAHLFEHMAFKGAGGRDARAFAEAIESVGGEINASTSHERTTYYARVVAEDAPFALGLIADIVLDPHWAPDDLDKEKGVVLQEIGKAADQPDDQVFELHQSTLYPGQSFGRPILGTPESLAGLKVSDLADFRSREMSPDRVVIAVAGAFDRAAILSVAQARFCGLTPQASPELPIPQAHPAKALQLRPIEQSHLVTSWPGPAAPDEASYAAWLLVEIFGGGMASRLFQQVREQRGLVYAINAYADAQDDTGRLGVYAGCAGKDVGQVLDLTTAVLAALAQDGPTATELARAKAVTRAMLLMGAESPAARAESRAAQAFLRNACVPYADLARRIAEVPAEAVQALAARALAGPPCVTVVAPKAAGRTLRRLGFDS